MIKYNYKCIYPDCLPECTKYKPLCNAGNEVPRPKNQFYSGILYGCLIAVFVIVVAVVFIVQIFN